MFILSKAIMILIVLYNHSQFKLSNQFLKSCPDTEPSLESIKEIDINKSSAETIINPNNKAFGNFAGSFISF